MVYSPNKYRETEGIKVRRLGYALDAATLQQIAYNNGIQQNINTMTQAQKSQLRYVAILQQSRNVMGDMARTVTTPANSMRILNQQMTQLQRAFGNIISVLAVKLIPYIQVGIRLLTDLANKLAEMWGFELPEIDYSGMEDGITGLSDDADSATESVKKTVKAVQRLAGFDEINVLKSAKEDADDTADALSNNFDLGIDLPEYDFLQGVTNSTEELYKKAKAWLKELYKWWQKHKNIIKAIASLLAGLWVVNKLSKYVDAIKNLFGFFKGIANLKGFASVGGFLGTLGKVLSGAGFGAAGGFFAYDFFKNLKEGTLDWKSALTDTLGVIGSIGLAFAVGGPLGGAIAIFGTLIGVVAGLNHELGITFDEAMIELFDNGGVKISDITSKFEKQYEQVNETSEKIKSYANTLNNNKQKIGDAQNEIANLTKAIENANGAMTKEQAEKIKENFEIIAKGIKDNLGLATQGILESFSSTINLTAEKIGIDLGNVIADIQGFEKTLTGNVDKAQEVINNYTDMLLEGATPTQQQTEAYEKAWGYFMDKARETSGYMQFQNEMSIDFSKIDFENEETFNEQLQKLTDAAKNAKQSVESTYQDALSLVSEQETEANRQYRYGMLDYGQYSAMSKQFGNVRKLLRADRDNQISEIEYNYSAITGAMQEQVDNSTKQWAELRTAQQHWMVLGLSNYPEKWSKEVADAIEAFKNTQRTEMDGVVHDNKEDWQNWYSSNVDDVRYNMHRLGERINEYASQIDVIPNKFAGRRWLQSMAENSKAELPYTLREMDFIMGEIRSEIDKEGKTAYMPSADVEKLVKERYYSLGESQKSEYLRGFDIDGINQTINNSLQNAGGNAGDSFGGSFASAIADRVQSVVNGLAQFFEIIPGFGNTLSLAFRNLPIRALFGVNGYANGGIVSADLFYANENGKAEFISSVGNRPAVANQDQMRSEIRKGVREGMLEALRSKQGDNGDIYVFIDSDQVAYRLERRSAQKTKMSGGR